MNYTNRVNPSQNKISNINNKNVGAAGTGFIIRNPTKGGYTETNLTGAGIISVTNDPGNTTISANINADNGLTIDPVTNELGLTSTPDLVAGIYPIQNITSLTCDGFGRITSLSARVPSNGGMAVYTSDNVNSFQIPNATIVKVTLIGGGGGGASSDQGEMGAGGGAGGSIIATLTIDPTQDYTLAIGAMGNGGDYTSGNYDGETGGSTTLSWGNNILSAEGGLGGSANYNGGLGGATSINVPTTLSVLSITGGGGGSGGPLDTTGSGIGGSALFGGAGAAVTTLTQGVDGSNGSGGSGGAGADGGNGGEGIAIFEW